MSLISFINPDVPFVKPESKVGDAVEIMNEFYVRELPVVDHNKVVALLKESLVQEVGDQNDGLTIGQITMNTPLPIVVLDTAHPYEAAGRMAEYGLSLLPVIDRKEQYKGVILKEDFFNHFFKGTGLNQFGGIVVLRLKPVDYSLSEIARICEGADTTLLNVQIFYQPGEETMEVVLKTNKGDLQTLKASFDRYDYDIVEIFGTLPGKDDLMNRYQLLLSYINM